jgi:hypothetical protein
VQQLSLLAPQFVKPAPLAWQLSGLAVHAPPTQNRFEPWQSVSVEHDVLHAVALAQIRLFGHAAGVPAAQLPVPLQVDGVSVLPAHDALPHAVPEATKTHAPAPSQSVAPHVVPVGVHAAAQQ